MPRFYPSLILLLACLSVEFAHAIDKPDSCEEGFSMFARNFVHALSKEELEAKRELVASIELKTLFPDSIEIPAGKAKGIIADIKPQQIGRFNRRFKEFINYESRLRPDLKDDFEAFEEWLRKKPGNRGPFPEINPIEMEKFKNEGVKFSDYFYDEFMKFKAASFDNNQQGFIDWIKSLKPNSQREVFASVRRVASKLFGYVTTGVVAGAVVANTATISSWAQGFSGGLLDPIIKMLFGGSDARRLGEEQAQALIGTMFDLFEGGREKYNDSLGVLTTTRGALGSLELDKMHRDQARSLLEEKDDLLGKELFKFARVLDRADKERHKKKLEYLKGMMAAVTIAKNDWNSQRAELDKIQDEIRKRNQGATFWEKRDIEKITASIKDAERTIAEAVATWQVYSHTLPEGMTLPDEVQRPFASLYGQYMRWMDLGEYRTAYLKVAQGYQEKLQFYYK